MDADHLDIYGDLASVIKAFADFVSQIQNGGVLLYKKIYLLIFNGIKTSDILVIPLQRRPIFRLRKSGLSMESIIST